MTTPAVTATQPDQKSGRRGLSLDPQNQTSGHNSETLSEPHDLTPAAEV